MSHLGDRLHPWLRSPSPLHAAETEPLDQAWQSYYRSRRVPDEQFSAWPRSNGCFRTVPLGVSGRRCSSALQSFLCDAALGAQLGGFDSGESPRDGGCLRTRAFFSDQWMGLSPCTELGRSIHRFAPPRSHRPFFARFTFRPILPAAVLRSRSVVQAAARSLICFPPDLIGFWMWSRPALHRRLGLGKILQVWRSPQVPFGSGCLPWMWI